MSNDTNQSAASPDEQRAEARYSTTSRLSALLASIGEHGSAATNAAVPHITVKDHSNSAAMKYDSFNDRFISATGETITPQQMNDRLAEAPVERIPDDGRDINAERARLAAHLEHLQKRLNETTGFDSAGNPLYVVQGYERDQLRRALEGGTQAFGFAMDELDALARQRQIDANARKVIAEDDAAREARIENEAVAEAERILIRERAERIIAARKRSGGNW